MSKTEPRIPLITREEWNDATLDLFALMERDEAAAAEARKNGSKMNIIKVLAHYPRVAMPFLEMGKSYFRLKLSMRLREIAVLRVGHLSNSEYEWFQHVAIGKGIGLTDVDIEAIKAGVPAANWSEIDGLVMRAVDELDATNTISDATWEAMSKHLDREIMFEFVCMISSYKMTAWILNTFQVPLDETPAGKLPV